MRRSADNPFFSVITPSWNQGAFIGRCIESVLAQGDSDFEHLVFDNESTDSTLSVAARYPHLQFVGEKDRGQSHAVNKGLDAARGEIVCWLNADDAYPPLLFKRLRELFADPKQDVVFGDVEQVSEEGSSPLRAKAFLGDRLDLVRWWTSDARIHQPAVFFRRKVARAIGPLREDLHYAMDYEYWWRMSGEFRFRYLDEVLAVQHRQPDSKTMRAWHKVYEERERIFAPFYGLVDDGDRRKFLGEKQRGLARRYLIDASAFVGSDRESARKSVWRAWHESPLEVMHTRNLGLIRRLLFKT